MCMVMLVVLVEMVALGAAAGLESAAPSVRNNVAHRSRVRPSRIATALVGSLVDSKIRRHRTRMRMAQQHSRTIPSSLRVRSVWAAKVVATVGAQNPPTRDCTVQ